MADDKKTPSDHAGPVRYKIAYFGDGGISLLGIGQVSSLRVCPDLERNAPDGTRRPGSLYSVEMMASPRGIMITHTDKNGDRHETEVFAAHIKFAERA